MRECGGKVWLEVVREVQKARKISELKKSLEGAPTEEIKGTLQKELDQLTEVEKNVIYPKKVDS